MPHWCKISSLYLVPVPKLEVLAQSPSAVGNGSDTDIIISTEIVGQKLNATLFLALKFLEFEQFIFNLSWFFCLKVSYEFFVRSSWKQLDEETGIDSMIPFQRKEQQLISKTLIDLSTYQLLADLYMNFCIMRMYICMTKPFLLLLKTIQHICMRKWCTHRGKSIEKHYLIFIKKYSQQW